MSRRRKPASHSNHERWLVSYADFITLLFAFFVVLYASSQVDKRKVGKLAMAIQVAFQEMGVFQASTTQVPLNPDSPMPFREAQAVENVQHTASLGRIVSRPDGALGGGPENGDLVQLENELQKALAAEIKRKEIAMRREPDGLVISLREVGFFESGSAQMKSSSHAAFDQIATMLLQRDYRLRIEGHTDDVPIHTTRFSSNWELSTARDGDRSDADCARWFCAGSPQCCRVCGVSSDCRQWHRGRARHESPGRYCDPGPRPASTARRQPGTANGAAVANGRAQAAFLSAARKPPRAATPCTAHLQSGSPGRVEFP